MHTAKKNVGFALNVVVFSLQFGDFITVMYVSGGVYNLYAYFHDLQTFTHYAQDYQRDLYSIKPDFIILIVYDFNSIFILSYRIVIVNL